ncbi:MAG: elongation factor G [Candidatus Omnitrophota bacterium]
MDAQNKRSIILLGHAQSGKTSLVESLLFCSKTIGRKGTIAEGNTASDYNFDEIERKSSINSSFLFCDYKGKRIQFIDTPGYADFFGEVLSAARAVDSAVIVIDAEAGVQVGTERAWQIAEENSLPVIFFVNKSDKPGIDANKAIFDIKDNLTSKAVVLDSLEDPALIEAVAESDDALLEKYLGGTALSQDELKTGLRQAVIKRNAFPIICGSALTDKGVAALLEVIGLYLPGPLERPKVEVSNPSNLQEKKELDLKSNNFSAYVFKSISDPYVGQLSLLRVFSGTLASNSGFYNVNKRSKERIGSIHLLQGKEQRNLESASAGDIIAIAKLKGTSTGDSLAEEKNQINFAQTLFPEPAISASVRPKSRADEDKISIALHKLTDEDPTLKITRDAQTKEMLMSGLGDLHLSVMIHRLKKRFNVDVELGTPKVSYMETITKKAKVQGKFKRQSGGRGQYGDVWIELEPLNRGSGFEFVDRIFGGAVPKNYIPAVEKGVRQACIEGAVAGHPMVDVRVTLVDGSYHDVDSSDMAFQIAGAMALRKAAMEANPVLLEPIMDVDVFIPEDFLGAISGDLNSRRGRITGMDVKGKSQVVKSQVPMSEMFTYANDLRSMTGGRGSYIMRFSHYEELPHKQAANIIQQYQANRKHEQEGHE